MEHIEGREQGKCKKERGKRGKKEEKKEEEGGSGAGWEVPEDGCQNSGLTTQF